MQCSQCGKVNKATAQFCSGCGNRLAPVPVFGSGTLTGRLPTNTILNSRYVIMAKVGQGGMAAVYQVMDTRITGRVCAIKEMSDAKLTDPLERQAAIQSFESEASLLARLEHPHIPRVHDYFQTGGKYYLVMDYVEGQSLEKLLVAQQRPFAESEVRGWLGQLCDALSYLHQQRPPIIFRDLKPDNIMRDQRGQIKLIDFGIAQKFDPTKRNDLFGTPGYAAPEQRGLQAPDARADIHALGVTLHRLLTGHEPSAAPIAPLPKPRTMNPAISQAMETVILRCVEHDPNARWQSMNEVAGYIGKSGKLSTGSIGGGSTTGPSGVGSGGNNLTRVVVTTGGGKPTTRLVNAMAKLTPRQLWAALGGLLLVIILGVVVLAPWVQRNLPFLWENLPLFLLAAPVTFAALKRVGYAFIAHAVVTFVSWAVLWLRMAEPWPALFSFFTGVALSGFLFEASFYYLVHNTEITRDPDRWKQEVGWYALTTMVASLLFYSPWELDGLQRAPFIVVCAALMGVVGWYIGDAIREELKRRGIIGP